MQIIMRNRPNAGYENRDTVTTVPDSHIWSPMELDTAEFIIEPSVTLTDNENQLLTMADETIKDKSSVYKLPTFRSRMMKLDALKRLHRRKYQYNNGLFLKPNAQELI